MQTLTIDIGDYLTLGGNSKYKITHEGVTGLEKPPIRSSGGTFAGADGGYISAQNYDVRNITIPGAYEGDDIADAEALRKALNALPIRTLIPVTITLPSGDSYVTSSYVYDLKNALVHAEWGKFQLLLTSPDPFLYIAGEGDEGWTSQTFFKTGGGGYPTPYTLPVEWASGETAAIVHNAGDIFYLPQIILEGIFTNPIITNATTGAIMQLDITTSEDQKIIIDMLNRTITLDGGSITAYKTDESSWWALYPGDNAILLGTDSGADTNTGIIRYRQGIEGI